MLFEKIRKEYYSLMIKLVTYLIEGTRNNMTNLRGLMFKKKLEHIKSFAGDNLKVLKSPTLIASNINRLTLGNSVNIGRHIVFDLKLGDIEVQNWVDLTHNVHIYGPAKIGNDVLIAENVTIGGTIHKATNISDDVWIGAGSFVENGASISKGVVIGAKSYVRASDELLAYGIYVGNPIRLIKYRL